MLRTTREIKSFSGVAWGQKAEVKLAGGPVYQELILTTNVPAALLSIELFINGDPRIQMTGLELVMLESYKKLWTEAGKFVIPLGDISCRNIAGQMLPGLETKPTDNIILKVSIGADPGGLGNASLSAEAWVNAPLGNAAGEALAIWHPRITTHTFDASASGKNVLDTLAIGPQIRRAHFKSSMNHLRILKGNGNSQAVVWERSAGTNSYMQKRFERAPQTGYYHFDPIESGFALDEVLKTDDTEILKMEITVPAPESISILLESLERVA